MTAEQIQFINKFSELMGNEARRRGYKVVSTALAQTIIEGNWGKSQLAKLAHNHWGLKCGSSWKGESINMKTKEEYSGQLVTIKDNFRKFKSDEEGVKGYYDFINTKRYANLKTAENYREYAQMLKADGYATSSSYVKTLCTAVEKYNLSVYDGQGTQTNKIILKPTIRKSSVHNPYAITLQELLNKHGNYNLVIDGIFGNKTEKAVKDFQLKHNLISDGVVGRKTWEALLS